METECSHLFIFPTLSERMTHNTLTAWINRPFKYRLDLLDFFSISVLRTSAGSFIWREVKHRWHVWAHQAVRQQGWCGGGYQLTSVFQVVLTYTLGRQFCQHIVQIVGVRVAVAGQIGTKLRLVVDLVPHHRVRLACGAGCADGEDEAPVPGHDQELEDLKRCSRDNEGDFNSICYSVNELFFLFLFYLSAFLVVGEVTVSREASRTKLFPRVWVLIGLREISRKEHDITIMYGIF